MSKKYIIKIVSFSIFLSGCSQFSVNSINQHALRISKDLNKSIVSSFNFKETLLRKKCIKISSEKTVSMILQELQGIDGNMYMLSKNSKNINIPSNEKYLIKSYDGLVEYLNTTTSYTLIITKNKYRKDLPKIIQVVHKKSVAKDIKKLSLPIEITSLGGTVTAKDALVLVAQKIKFSLIFKYNDFKEAKKSLSVSQGANNGFISIFDNSVINFYGNTLPDFFSYIEESFDVFVFVDYVKKQIIISKYKTSFFKLVVADINMESKKTSTGNASGSTGVGRGGKGSTSLNGGVSGKLYESKSVIKMYKELEEKLNKVFKSRNGASFGSNEEYYDINNNNGEVLVVAGEETTKKAKRIIENFNKSYTKSIYLDFRIFEVLVYKRNTLGSKISSQGEKLNANSDVAGGFVGFMNYLTKINGSSFGVTLKSIQDYGHIVKGYRAYGRAINNIPKSLQLSIQEEYVSSIVDNTTTTTGTVNTQISNVTSSLSYGKTITFKPKMHDSSASVEIEYESIGKPDLKNRKIGNNEIEIAKNKTNKKIREVVNLRDGETVIVNLIEDTISSKNYKGTIPIDDFILGGESGREYIKTETIFLFTIKNTNEH